MLSIFLLLFYLLAPAIIIYITEKNKFANKIGAIIIAYGIGLLIGNIGIFPHPGDYLSNYLTENHSVSFSEVEDLLKTGLISPEDIEAYKVRKLQDLILMLTIPLAIPLLLFSLQIKNWLRMARTTFISLLLGLISVMFVVVALSVIFKNILDEIPKIAGMLVGLYTGGTPNLAALKMMLNVNPDLYIKVHTYDMISSLLFLLFLMTVGKILFRNFLMPYPVKTNSSGNDTMGSDAELSYNGIFKRKVLTRLLLSILLSVIIFGLAGLATLFVNTGYQMLVVILILSTLAILLSLVPAVQRIQKTFEAGMYLILIFSIAVASMANLQNLLQLSGYLLVMITVTVFGSLILHTVLSKIFKVDADLMISSTAMICSPPFVPMIAGALKNKEIIISGLTVGIIGYAAGNYLGVAIAFIIRSML
ncbi:MAG: DUF819 family protein [Bacteroidales bacterium]|nr:DUF819 family protein [Bacteroidales bacterium]